MTTGKINQVAASEQGVGMREREREGGRGGRGEERENSDARPHGMATVKVWAIGMGCCLCR